MDFFSRLGVRLKIIYDASITGILPIFFCQIFGATSEADGTALAIVDALHVVDGWNQIINGVRAAARATGPVRPMSAACS